MTDGATEKAKKGQLLDFGLSAKASGLGKSATLLRLKRDGDRNYGSLSLLKLCFQEKLLKISYRRLYREPTQVVKERILR